MAITQDRLTLEEFLKLPERKPALEFENGTVIQKVSPKLRHSTLQGELVERINRFARPKKLARAFPELRTTFGGFSRVPDVAVYLWERIPRDANGEFADDCREPPDIAIEIVSPGQGVNALVRRCLLYVEHGLRIAALVDPGDRSVIVFRPDSRTSALRGAESIDFGDVTPGLRIPVEELFASLSGR